MSIRDRLNELVPRIQAGEQELMPELWQCVERLVKWQANRVIKQLSPAAGVTFDDLYNSGYLALVDAVDRYEDRGSNGFVALFMLCLKKAFNEASGARSNKSQQDPLWQINTASLDAPLDGAEDMTLSDTVADEADAFEGIEECIYNEQLHNELERILGTIPDNEVEVLRHRYYDGLATKATADIMGVEPAEARRLEGNALRNIRRSKSFGELRQFIEDNTLYYKRVSVQSYQRTGVSSVEMIAMQRERLEKQFCDEREEEKMAFEEYKEKIQAKYERIAADEAAGLRKMAV